jgi:hypothetical protein
MPNHLTTHEVFSLLATHYKGKPAPTSRSAALARTTQQLADVCLEAAVPTPSQPLHLAMLLLHLDYASEPPIGPGDADIARSATLLEWASLLAILTTPEGTEPPAYATVKAQALGLTDEERESAALTWLAISDALDSPEQDIQTRMMAGHFWGEVRTLRYADVIDSEPRQ